MFDLTYEPHLCYTCVQMRQKISILCAMMVLLSVCLCGCSVISDSISGVFAPEEPVDTHVVAQWWAGPRIRTGIALIIQVGTPASHPQMMEVLVDQKGEITIPLLLQKPVHCDGLTLDALKTKLVKEYSRYYRQPQVTVTFAPYDGKGVSPWGTVTVLGEVLSPGPVNIPSTMDLPVTKVLQMAGGLKPYADRTRICVTRCNQDGKQHKTYVDLKEIGKDGRPDKDMLLRAGDVVWVPETWY